MTCMTEKLHRLGYCFYWCFWLTVSGSWVLFKGSRVNTPSSHPAVALPPSELCADPNFFFKVPKCLFSFVLLTGAAFKFFFLLAQSDKSVPKMHAAHGHFVSTTRSLWWNLQTSWSLLLQEVGADHVFFLCNFPGSHQNPQKSLCG